MKSTEASFPHLRDYRFATFSIVRDSPFSYER